MSIQKKENESKSAKCSKEKENKAVIKELNCREYNGVVGNHLSVHS